MTTRSDFIAALDADGPLSELADKLALYGRFVGDWTFDATRWTDDGNVLSGRGEIHFGWVLEGRAIQDVWILPARDADPSPSLGDWTFFGTTLRLYDPDLDAWHILWGDARTRYLSRQLGHAEGGRIVQDGSDAFPGAVRWSFNDISDDGFRWMAERSLDGGATWRREVEFLARRSDGRRAQATHHLSEIRSTL